MTEEYLHTQDRRRTPSGAPPGGLMLALFLLIIVAGIAWYWYTSENEAEVATTDHIAAEPVVQSESQNTEDGPATEQQSPRDQTTAKPTEIVSPPTPSATIEAPPPPLPALEVSDDFVRDKFNDWGLVGLLTEQSDLVARLSVVLANAADGTVPKRQLQTLGPAEKFQVEEVGEFLYLKPDSYQRYDNYVDLLERISPNQAANFIALIEPLLTDGLVDLGDTRSPRSLITEAITRLDNLPALPEEIELKRKGAVYAYADERLEALPEFEKQLLRLGPQNLERLRTWTRAFAASYAAD